MSNKKIELDEYIMKELWAPTKTELNIQIDELEHLGYKLVGGKTHKQYLESFKPVVNEHTATMTKKKNAKEMV